MLKKLLKIFLITVIILILIAGITVLLHWRTNVISDSLRGVLKNTLSDVADINYRTLEGDIFQEIHLTDFSIKFHTGITLTANRIDIYYSLFSTVSEEFHFDDIYLDSLGIIIQTEKTEEAEVQADSYQDLLSDLDELDWYTHFISSLPDLRFGRLVVQYARLQIPDNDFTLDNINLAMSGYANPQSFDIDIKKISGQWTQKKLVLKDFGARFQGNPTRLNISKLRAHLPESRLFGSGDATFEKHSEFIISFEDAHINYQDISGLVSLTDIDSAVFDLDCHLIGRPDSFFVQSNLTGYFNQYSVDVLKLSAGYDHGDIYIKKGNLNSGENRFGFFGKVAGRNSYLSLNFKNFNISDFVDGFINTNLNGNLRTNLDQLTLSPLNGRGKLVLVNSRIDTISIDSLRFELAAKNNDLQIIPPSFLKFADSARFTVAGSLDRNQIADLKLSTENLNLLQLSQALKIDSLIGSIDANLYIAGNILDPNVLGYLWVPHFKKDIFLVDSMILQVKIDNLLSSRQGDAYLSMNRGEVGPLFFDETNAELIFDSNIVYIDTLLFANGPNYISSRGMIKSESDTIRLELDRFRIFYEQYWIDNQGSIIVKYDPQEINVEQAIFVAPDEGRLELRGYWDQDLNELQTGLLLRNINIAPVEQFLQNEINLNGIIEGDFEIYDYMNELSMAVELKGENIAVNDAPFGNIRCAFKYENDRFFFDEFTMRHDSASVQLDGAVAWQVAAGDSAKKFSLLEKGIADLNLSWRNILLEDYSPLLKLPHRLSGILSGNFQLTGTLDDPSGSLNIRTDNIAYQKFRIDSSYTHVRFDRENIYIDSMYTDLNGTMFNITGTQKANIDLSNLDTNIIHMPMELQVTCIDDSLEFIGFLTDQVERILGPFKLDLKIAGTPLRPVMQAGSFKLTDGILELTRVKNPVRDVYIEADIAESILTINEFSGYSEAEKGFLDNLFSLLSPIYQLLGISPAPEGVISGEGKVNLNELTHPVVDLSLVMNDFYIDYFVENTELILTSRDLRVTGRDTLMVTGTINVTGRYVPDLEKLKKNIYLTRREIKEQGRQLGYDLYINIPGNFVISSSTFDFANNFQFEIIGDLHAVQEPASNQLELLGNLDINSGNYGSWGQDFEIQSGKIVFTDPKVINPDVDILAEKSSRGLIFELSIRGNLENQQVDLQVRDENDQYLSYTMSDKITLLSLGSTSDQLSSASLAAAGEDVINTSVETAFSRGAESVTGLDKVAIDMQGSMVDLQSMKLNNGLQDASLSLGKYIFSNLYLEYTSKMGGGTIPTPKLSWEPGNQIGLKYRINKNWSINSDYSQTQRGNNMIQISLSWKKTF